MRRRGPRLTGLAGRALGARIAWVRRHGRPLLAPVSSLGWTVLGLGLAAWVLGWRLGWSEMMLLSACCLLLFAGCLAFLVGRAQLSVQLTLDPARVTVGQPASCEIAVQG